MLSVCTPCCGSGGMLTIAKEHITAGETRDGERRGEAVNPDADIHLFGQKVNPETFAICKSDLFMKSEDGRDAENVLFGSTLSNDRHAGDGFDLHDRESCCFSSRSIRRCSRSRSRRARGPGTARGGHTRSSSGTSRAVARLLSAFTDPGFTPRSMAER